MEIDAMFLDAVMSIMPGNFFWKNREGLYLGCNDNVVKLLKLNSRQDIIGKTIHDLVEKVNADMVAKNDEHIMSTKQELTLEEHVVDDDGSIRIFLTKKVPLCDSQGNVIGLVGTSFDISERKKVEETLRIAKNELEQTNNSKSEFINKMLFLEEIIALLPGNVYWKNNKGIYLGCNENMAKILNLPSRESIAGKTAYELTSKENADNLSQQDELIMRENTHSALEEKGFDVHGNPAIYLTNKVPLHNDQGEVIGILGLSFDITERKNLENMLRIAKEKAEAANQMKTEFIRNMEHDIRTPFNGILALANILEIKEQDPEKKEYLGDIARSAKELLDYCNVVLDFSTIEAGGFPIMAKKFDIKALIDSIILMETPSVKYKQLTLQVEYDDSIPNTLIGDSYRLQRILINLVSNSVKFTNSGKICLSARLARLSSKEVILKFIVQDTGIGMAKDTQNFIYEKFTRATAASKGIYKGMGLGLRAVKQFIQEMEGEIDVTSEIGKGTTFVCTLPFDLPLLYEIASENT